MRIQKAFSTLALAATLTPAAVAQVERVELDIAGYLCGF